MTLALPPIRTPLRPALSLRPRCCRRASLLFPSYPCVSSTDIKIKRDVDQYKFKLRLGKYLHTIVVKDKSKAQKMIESFVVPTLKVIHIGKKAEEKADE